MFKCLNPAILGLSGRQSELIELTLTYGFRAIELDLPEVARRVEQQGAAAARRLLESAKLSIGGSELPLGWYGDSVAYENELGQIERLATAAAAMGVRRCWTYLQPAGDERPYHENFELHRRRLQEIGGLLDKHGILLGVGLQAGAELRASKAFQFLYQPDQLLLLVKSVSANNVGVVVDTWDWHVGAGGNLDSLQALRDVPVACVRLADAPTDEELSSVTSTRRLVPGESGAVDFPAVHRALVECGADCPVTVHADPSRFAGRRRDEVVKQVSAILDDFLAGVRPSDGESARLAASSADADSQASA